MVVRALCPVCGRLLRRRVHVPFVFWMIPCLCGVEVEVRNPAVSNRYIARARRCCECGYPIPPVPKRHCTILRSLTRTCPACWQHHRNDEPSDDIGTYLHRWTEGRVAKTRVAAILLSQQEAVALTAKIEVPSCQSPQSPKPSRRIPLRSSTPMPALFSPRRLPL